MSVRGCDMKAPVCVECGRIFKIFKNGVIAIEYIEKDCKTPYKLYRVDLWKCPGCDWKILSGFGDPIYCDAQPAETKKLINSNSVYLNFY